MLDASNSSVEAEEQALKEGLVVVRSTPKTLLLDLDNAAAVAQYVRMREKVREFYALNVGWEWKSRSGNQHVVLELRDPLPVETRLLLQAVLGSDPMRELLARQRLVHGETEPCLLFRPPHNPVNRFLWA